MHTSNQMPTLQSAKTSPEAVRRRHWDLSASPTSKANLSVGSQSEIRDRSVLFGDSGAMAGNVSVKCDFVADGSDISNYYSLAHTASTSSDGRAWHVEAQNLSSEPTHRKIHLSDCAQKNSQILMATPKSSQSTVHKTTSSTPENEERPVSGLLSTGIYADVLLGRMESSRHGEMSNQVCV